MQMNVKISEQITINATEDDTVELGYKITPRDRMKSGIICKVWVNYKK